MKENIVSAVSSKGHLRPGGYSTAKMDAKQDRKRQEAEDRQSVYDGLSASAKIARVKSRRGESKRELARLTKLEAKTVVKPFVPVPAAILVPVAAAPVPEKKKRTKKQIIASAKMERPSKS